MFEITTRLYYLIIVIYFFANYLDALEKDCPKGQKLFDMRNRPKFLVRGVLMDIQNQAINQILFGQL